MILVATITSGAATPHTITGEPRYVGIRGENYMRNLAADNKAFTFTVTGEPRDAPEIMKAVSVLKAYLSGVVYELTNDRKINVES